MGTRSDRVAAALATFQFVDAVACAIPLDYIKADLDRIGCPEDLQRALPAIKAAAGAGLVAGRRSPGLRRLTAGALVAYYAIAVGFHVRADDEAFRSLPAASLALTSAYVAATAA